MYIQCKKDFLKGRFKFQKDAQCPITNIIGDTYYFFYPDGTSDFISTGYLNELKEYVEVRKETSSYSSCNHDMRERIWNLIICSGCEELIEVLEEKTP